MRAYWNGRIQRNLPIHFPLGKFRYAFNQIACHLTTHQRNDVCSIFVSPPPKTLVFFYVNVVLANISDIIRLWSLKSNIE